MNRRTFISLFAFWGAVGAVPAFTPNDPGDPRLQQFAQVSRSMMGSGKFKRYRTGKDADNSASWVVFDGNDVERHGFIPLGKSTGDIS